MMEQNQEMDRKRNEEQEHEKIFVTETQLGGTEGIEANESMKVTPDYDRKNYESSEDVQNRQKYKEKEFADNPEIVDPVTGKELVQNQKQAKEQFGDDYAQHAAETDHIQPVKNVHEQVKKNPFLKDEDIQKIVNDEKNYELRSKSGNASKGENTNREYIDKKKADGKEIHDENGELQRQKNAEKYISREIKKATARNVANEAVSGAGQALMDSAVPLALILIRNIWDVSQSKKKFKEAVKDVTKAVGSVAGMGAATQLLKTGLKGMDNALLKNLLNSNLPAILVSTAFLLKDDVMGWKNHELTGQEFAQSVASKMIGLMGGQVARRMTSEALAGLVAQWGISCTFGIEIIAGTAVAKYLTDVSRNLFDEVLGHGAWEKIRNAEQDVASTAEFMQKAIIRLAYDQRAMAEQRFYTRYMLEETDRINERVSGNMDKSK